MAATHMGVFTMVTVKKIQFVLNNKKKYEGTEAKTKYR